MDPSHLQQDEEQDQADELAARSRWLNSGLATAITWLVIMLTDKAIAPEIDLSRSFGKYLVGAAALQLVPMFFGWLARKIEFCSEKWRIVYWVALVLMLSVRAVMLSRLRYR